MSVRERRGDGHEKPFRGRIHCDPFRGWRSKTRFTPGYSLFAYVADGRNGLRMVELMGPDTTPQFRGFSPPLNPRLIATYPTAGPALAVSKGLDRDRAVDESGNQLAAFGRLGARPMNLEEMQRMYLRDGELFKVSNEPAPDETPRAFALPEK